MGLLRTIALTVVVAGLGGSALAQQNTAEAAKIEGAVKGAWKNASGGSCEPAYFKTAEENKTVRGEAGMKVTVVNAGMTINGTLILAGAREGQIVNPMTDKVIFALEPTDDGKVHISSLGEPALSWPDVVLDPCPGTR
ncbi:MAG TPA: hypothetical protein VNH44_00400 [Micropepsaceae bacterium]|nr:hypothetical protein [Micropepsaceae bacterium]